MTDRARSTRELGWFFALALGATAVLHGSIALLGFPFSLAPDSPALPLYLLGLATPTAAALALCDSGERWRFLGNVLRARGSAGVYACAVVAQPCILALAWCLSHLGPEPVPPRFSVSSGFALLALGQIWVVLGEEIGWRGFALPRLEQILSPRLATLGLAAAWGLWHSPMFLVSGSLQAREPIWLFGAAIFAWSSVHTALYHRAAPSVVANLVFHGCANLALNLVAVPQESHHALAAAYSLVGLATWGSLQPHSVHPVAPVVVRGEGRR